MEVRIRKRGWRGIYGIADLAAEALYIQYLSARRRTIDTVILSADKLGNHVFSFYCASKLFRSRAKPSHGFHSP